MREICRYEFADGVDLEAIEDTLLISILAAEGLHGRAQIRLNVSYWFERDRRSCLIDATSVVGRDVCCIFTALAIREFGDDSFSVRRITDVAAKPTGAAA